jgi:hypothetical protein
MTLLYGYFVAAIVLDHAHLVCPIGLAWTNPRFRSHMLEHWEKFVLLPVLCITIPLAVGSASRTTHDPAFRVLVAMYFYANAWHFSSQNYGICALYGGTGWQRVTAFALTAVFMIAVPRVALWIVLCDLGISLMHWIMDLRLSGYAAQRQWLFTAAVLVIGASIGFVWKTVGEGPRQCGPFLAVCTAQWPVPALLGLRFGIGFWHFLMSRWVWSAEGRAALAH